MPPATSLGVQWEWGAPRGLPCAAAGADQGSRLFLPFPFAHLTAYRTAGQSLLPGEALLRPCKKPTSLVSVKNAQITVNLVLISPRLTGLVVCQVWRLWVKRFLGHG